MKFGSFPDTIARQEVEAVDAGEWKPVPACTEPDINRLK
jgi:hypothetical protein